MAAAKEDRGVTVRLRVKPQGRAVIVEDLDEDTAEQVVRRVLLADATTKPLEFVETREPVAQGGLHRRWDRGQAKPKPEDFCPSGGKKARLARAAARRTP